MDYWTDIGLSVVDYLISFCCQLFHVKQTVSCTDSDTSGEASRIQNHFVEVIVY